MPNKALAEWFGMCKLWRMDITDLRKEMGLSLEAFGALVGLKSKGHVWQLENGGTVSVRVALEIERLSEGRIPAGTLNTDVALVESFRSANDPSSRERAA